MKLSVPFLPDLKYAGFLAEQKSSLASVYFPLPPGPAEPVFDARIRPHHTRQAQDLDALSNSLAPLDDIKKYVLVNTRFLPPAIYTDPPALNRFLDKIAVLDKSVGISGLVISDFYLTNALDRTGHDIITALEAVPGVNCMMDSLDKVMAYLEIIEQTRFKPPGRLLLDRSLNRYLHTLNTLVPVIKKRISGIRVELLANEGCILHCPFKPAHDAQIALSNTGLVRESTYTLNRTAGCHAYFFKHPHRFLKSPFIRPEDTPQYQGVADTVKLCGRTLGPGFLTQCIKAYIDRSFDGNLLDLMDATAFMADRFHIDNKALGSNFFNEITTCTKQCKQCRICAKLYQKAAYKKSVGFKPYKEI